MKIVSIRSKSNYTPEQITTLKSYGEFIEITGKKLQYVNIMDKIKDVDILLISPSGLQEVPKVMLSHLKKLKFISLLSVGYEWVDIKAAKSRGILISSIKGANSESVAEHI